jgi:ribose 5-phosphate isomerase A
LSIDPQLAAKRNAAIQAASFVEDGMRIGLGTGSTTALALEEIGRRIREENLSVVGTPTSSSAALLARKYSIPTSALDALGSLDMALDGADEVDPDLNLTKGRGAAHTREKIVASQAARFLVLVDNSKLVERLGSRVPVPVEIVPMAVSAVSRRIEFLGGRPELRMGARKDGPVVTDQGFWLIDAHFDPIDDVASLNTALLSIPGVLDHGLFLGMATDVFVGSDEGNVRHLTR